MAFVQRNTFILLIVLATGVALVYAFLWRDDGSLWRLIMLKRFAYENQHAGQFVRGWRYVNRWEDGFYGRWHWLPANPGDEVAIVPIPLPNFPSEGHSSSVLGEDVRGWQHVKVDSGIRHGRGVTYYLRTGFQATENLRRDGLPIRGTTWRPDGTIDGQVRWTEKGERIDNEWPPWWWDVEDQEAPTAPWWDQERR